MYTTIIASLAGEPLLAEALSSVREQTLPPSRVIVVCDAGDPLPAEWTTKMRRILPTVEFHRNDPPGQVPAQNRGIELVTTPYLAFLDSDDIWQPEKQERQLALLEQEPELDAVGCLAANFTIDEDGHQTVEPAAVSVMFTCMTFRRSTFERFGQLHPDSTHFTWLYRWWGEARRMGITTRSIDYLGTLRRLHGANSWSAHRGAAHRDLLAEIRRQARLARGQE